VNFYKRFIGDIQAKTGGLTLAEFGAYDRLLDHYYSTELPVPADEVHRICRAMSAVERAAVNKVLHKFFEKTEAGWVQGKAEEQIARALPLIEAARENGKKGGRPPKQKTHKEPAGFPKQNPNTNPAETQPVKASQSQSQSQTHSPPLRSGEVGCAALPGVSDSLFGDYLEVRRAKKAGKFTATSAAGILREAERAGVTVERALQACCEFGWIGFNAKWYADRVGNAKSAGSNGHNGHHSGSPVRAARMAEASPDLVANGHAAAVDFIDTEARDVTPRRLD
jgi:uncharacterized protein YdaU (DUF1376 family)